MICGISARRKLQLANAIKHELKSQNRKTITRSNRDKGNSRINYNFHSSENSRGANLGRRRNRATAREIDRDGEARLCLRDGREGALHCESKSIMCSIRKQKQTISSSSSSRRKLPSSSAQVGRRRDLIDQFARVASRGKARRQRLAKMLLQFKIPHTAPAALILSTSQQQQNPYRQRSSASAAAAATKSKAAPSSARIPFVRCRRRRCEFVLATETPSN